MNRPAHIPTERNRPPAIPARPRPAKKGPSRLRHRINAAVWRLCWTYLILIFAFWIYLFVEGDRSYYGTLFLFGPLWVTTLPAMALAPAALLLHRRALLVLAPAVWIALVPIMGLCTPWRQLFHRPGHGPQIRVLTCNINLESMDEVEFNDLIAQTKPDIVLLQEFPHDRPAPLLPGGNWHVRRDNELVIESRFPIEKNEYKVRESWFNFGGNGARYDIAGPAGLMHVFNLHLASPHLPFQAVMDGVPSAQTQLQNHLNARAEQSEFYASLARESGGSVIIGGDFNSRCEGSIYRGWWADFSDAYNSAGWGFGRTYFSNGAAVRIDHILSGKNWRCTNCEVGPSIGSPHRPVIADFEWMP